MTDELNDDSTFSEKIEHNKNICSNCYRRLITKILEPHNTLPDVVTQQREYSDSVYFDYFGDEYESGRPSRKKSYCECGSVDDGKIRPFDESQMMDVAVRVRQRLAEKDVEVDEDVFFESIKSEFPDHRFNEEKILEKATERAINAYNG